MSSLVRTRVGNFCLEEALTLGQLQELRDRGELAGAVRPVDSMFQDSPVLHVQEEFLRFLENGNVIQPEQTVEKECYAPGRWVRVYRPDESFAGIYAYDRAGGKYRPVKMFL